MTAALPEVRLERLPTDDGFRVAAIGSTKVKPGLYRIHWRSGGSSEAAIGMCNDGSWWVAPINWVTPAVPLPITAQSGITSWASVERLEALF